MVGPGAAVALNSQELEDALASGGGKIRKVETRPDVRRLDALGESVMMLLYLNKDTWAEQASVLESDVRMTHSFAHGLGVSPAHGNRPSQPEAPRMRTRLSVPMRTRLFNSEAGPHGRQHVGAGAHGNRPSRGRLGRLGGIARGAAPTRSRL